MCSLYSSEPSEAADAVRGDGSPFTPLWAKVNFSTTLPSTWDFPKGPPPGDFLPTATPKSGFWGRFGGEKYVLQPLVGARLAQRFHPGRRIFLDLAKHLGKNGGASPLEYSPPLTFSDQLLRKRE